MNYIELPVNFIFKPVLGNGQLLLGLGPYIAYGIGGKVELSGSGMDFEKDIKFENDLSESQLLDDEVLCKTV